MVLRIDAAAFTAWTELCVASLSSTRAEIDAMNVFPVPDSDTGTNAYLTFVSGAEAVADAPADLELPALVRHYLDGLLTGARGNSGVILSQLVRGCFAGLPLDGEVDAAHVAEAFERATDASYVAVGDPKEGTILSVARAASEGARRAAEEGRDARDAFTIAAAAARKGLRRTPEQMEVLARAGVVDAGGRALVVVLDATEQALTGRMPDPVSATVPVPVAAGDDLVEGGPGYEVMYLLDADDDRIAELRRALAPLGDSLVVVGGDGLWNVHVHVDDVGAAIEAGIAAGHPRRITVTHFADQVARQRRSAGRRVVVVATTGPGITALCEQAGAVAVPFTRDEPLGGDLVRRTILGTDADEVIVLPNNQRYVGLFEAAAKEARQSGVRVAVIPTAAQVQGLAALAVHDAGIDFDDDVVAMSSAAGHTAHGAVTVATEPGMTMVGPCVAGDVLGVVSGDFAVVGGGQLEVAAAVLERLLSPASELVTVVTGHGAEEDLGPALVRHLARSRPDVDAEVHEGGQENYPLFLAVE
ncbi:DAK2 domain fusion protein YloV [Aeromicrobium marinum DSM 15272]|uniref:DAK2 domain fusion protein YloV n=1 Tax=Aeromicrobium marinum DSM 15272 TaxID=585531 RepID=E2SAZ3_9ACTN|nr:DAK2 domain-containing protein [Aeromicrobium marinum]EFQ83539.1 DAK2 domain fusion protein YloV [Aeromicrobium marinum DSM 15272]